MNKDLKPKSIWKNKRIVLIVLLTVLLFVIIFIINANTKKIVPKIENKGFELNIAINGGNIDISNIISEKPNAPTVSAGMIPIKWNGTNWVITNKDDSEWYDYSNGIWANVMLSDGEYSSELTASKKLASENEGKELLASQMGTIYTWIPRLCYNNTRNRVFKRNKYS